MIANIEKWSQLLDFTKLAEEYGTPAYILNLNQIERNFNDYLGFAEKPENIFFPVKANPAIALLRKIESLNGGVDCASQNEIKLAKLSGFSSNRIIYNSPDPDLKLVIDLLSSGGSVVIDSEEMVQWLNENLKVNNGKLFIRINPEISFDYDEKTNWENLVSHAHTTTKFGIPSENIINVLKLSDHKITGLHIHVGTQMDNTKAFTNMLSFLHSIIDRIHTDTTHHIDTLDIGGGLGIPFTVGQNFPSINELVDVLIPLKRSNLNYCVEPGHSLVGNAVGIITKVSTVKQVRSKKWAIADVGTDQLAKITLLRWFHQVLDSKHQPLELKGSDSLGGPLCFSGDTLLPDTELNNVQKGDVLFIQHCGAYCYALGNSFNGRLDPVHIAVEDEKVIGIVKNKEDFFDSPNIINHQWKHNREPAEPISFGQEDINRLSSKYLREISCEDKYKYLSCHSIEHGSYLFEIETTSAVDFISMPFVIRIVGDSSIVSACNFLGKKDKDLDIWGSKLSMKCCEKIITNGTIICRIDLSELNTKSCGRKHMLLSQFSLDGGKSSGTFQLSFKT